MKIVDDALSALEIVQERIEKEKELKPIKMLGIPLTMGIISAINTSVLSLATAMANQRFSLL